MKCNECDKVLNEGSLKRHMDEVHGVKKFKCEYCDKAFSRKHDVERHLRTKHVEDDDDDDTICYLCMVKRIRH